MRYKGDLTYHGQEFKFTNETKHVVSVFLENLFLGSAAILLLDSLPYLSIIPLMPALGIPILVAGGLIAGAFILNYCENGFNANAALGNTLRDLALNFA